MKQEAYELGADKVVGVRTHINEFGNLTEYMVVGTAVKKMQGMQVRTPELPAQAIIRDKTTWVGNASGFSLE